MDQCLLTIWLFGTKVMGKVLSVITMWQWQYSNHGSNISVHTVLRKITFECF